MTQYIPLAIVASFCALLISAGSIHRAGGPQARTQAIMSVAAAVLTAFIAVVAVAFIPPRNNSHPASAETPTNVADRSARGYRPSDPHHSPSPTLVSPRSMPKGAIAASTVMQTHVLSLSEEWLAIDDGMRVKLEGCTPALMKLNLDARFARLSLSVEKQSVPEGRGPAVIDVGRDGAVWSSVVVSETVPRQLVEVDVSGADALEFAASQQNCDDDNVLLLRNILLE
jgi:hypothetical protein